METFGLEDAEMNRRLVLVQSLVAQPMPKADVSPAHVGESLFVGNKYHASDVEALRKLGVTAVLNCAPSGIRNLPLGCYQQLGIEYEFTNVSQDAQDYPILHTHADGARSEHLEVALAFYAKVVQAGGRALFFCVAGQNRSACLACAVLLTRGHTLQQV